MARNKLASDYAENIYTKLEHIQQNTSLINPDCDVRGEEYGVQLSGIDAFSTHSAST
jgi:hypothetical protein